MQQNFNTIIIGGGHNGLTCAAYLARAGHSVLVLEAASQIGGAARSRTIAEGSQVFPAAHLLHSMPEKIVNELQLEQNGLQFAAKHIKTVSLNSNGAVIVIANNQAAGDQLTAGDIEGYGRFYRDMQRFSKALVPVFDKVAPELAIESWRQKLDLLGFGWTIRKLGKFHMREFLRIIGMNLYDLMDEYIENPQLKAAIAMDALLGSEWGARSMGSVLTYLYRQAGELRNQTGIALPCGGMGAVSLAIAQSAQQSGAEIRCNSAVKNIIIDSGKAVGVELETGERILAETIVSNADPKHTFLTLVNPDHLGTNFVRQVNNLRSKGKAGKLHLALSQQPEFKGLDNSLLGERLVIAPSMDDIELAFNPSKYRRYPEAPIMEIILPSVSDDSLCQNGQQLLSAVVQYLPYDDSVDEDENRADMLKVLIGQLEQYAPGISELIIAAELLTPRDIEREFGISGGHWHHVELVFESFMFNRPTPLLTRHATPIGSLFLCGAGCHPGGNVMGIAGRNAAQQVLRGGK